MNSTNLISHQSRRLLQLGVALLLFISFEGFAFPYFAAPHLALSVHTLGALEGVMLISFGLLWPRLNLGSMTLRFTFWLLVYSALSILTAYFLAAIWGAGSSTMPMAAGSLHGSTLQEMIIKIVAYSSAPTGIISFLFILIGLK